MTARLLSSEKIDSKMIDLRIGNPAFLKDYWQVYANTVSYPSNLFSSMDYEKEGGRKSLKDKIILLHKEVKNANHVAKTLVIGNGATQMINATLYAIKEKYRISVVCAKAPYWFRFPEMSEVMQMEFSEFDVCVNEVPNWDCGMEPVRDRIINIVTCPSNPEGLWAHGVKTKHTIFDLCYNWPQYTKDVRRIDEDIMIFSLAKATGHGASRIGWGFFKDPDIADLVQKYIEYDTGGVSVEAQTKAEFIITDQLRYVEDTSKRQFSCFHKGRDVLNDRWDRLKKAGFLGLHGNHKAKIKILNNSGMFAWAEYLKDETNVTKFLEKKYDLLVLDGVGSDPSSKNKIRMNIGCSPEMFNKFIEKFS